MIAALLMTNQGAAETLAGRVSVIDGDTLDLHDQRIRLFGIDTPERGQTCTALDGKAWRCGTAAARALDDMVSGRTVICTKRDTDRYGRIVATCEAGGRDLGSELVEQGLAVAYRSFSEDYIPQEDRARIAGRGMWSGHFEMPWEWRKNN